MRFRTVFALRGLAMEKYIRIQWKTGGPGSRDAITWAICIVAVFLFLCCASRESAAQGGLVPFVRDGKWGYKKASGEVVIQPRFEVAYDFSAEGIAAVVDDEGWAYINADGFTVIRPFVFDNGPDYFEEGLARFRSESKFGFFDRKGRVIIEPRFDFALPFHDGLAAVCSGCKEELEGEHRSVKGGVWGYIDRRGAVVFPPRCEEAGNFANGRARVKCNGEESFIDVKGKVIEGGTPGARK